MGAHREQFDEQVELSFRATSYILHAFVEQDVLIVEAVSLLLFSTPAFVVRRSKRNSTTRTHSRRHKLRTPAGAQEFG
jgi:hypothetical protein